MLAAMLVTLVLIMLVSSVLVTSMQTANNSRVMLDAMRDRALLDEWSAVLRKSAVPMAANGQMAMPKGGLYEQSVDEIVVDRYNTLPAGFGGRRLNSWGIPLVYCPYGVSAVTVPTGSIATGLATDYNIETVDFSGEQYVTASAAHPDAVVAAKKPAALIISSFPTAAVRPTCDDVRYDIADGVFYLPGNTGMVEGVRFVSTGPSTGSAGGGFVSYVAGDTSTFNSSMAMAFSSSSNYTAIEIPEGEVLLLTGDISHSGATNQIVEIFSTGAGASIDAASARTFAVSGVTLILRNITIADDVTLTVDAVRLFTDTVDISAIVLKDSQWRIGALYAGGGSGAGQPAITADSSSIVLDGADVALNATITSPVLVQLNSTDLTSAAGSFTLEVGANEAAFALNGVSRFTATQTAFTSSNLSTAGDALWRVSDGAVLTLLGAAVSVTENLDSVVTSTGVVTVSGGSIAATGAVAEAFRIERGSLAIDGAAAVGAAGASTITTVVMDVGGQLYRGTSAHLYGATCWAGPAFASAASGVTGSSAAIANDYLKAINQTQWTCN